MTIYSEWDGKRVKHPEHPAIYLVENGKKRLIPNQATYLRLFVDWDGIIKTPDVDKIPTGDEIDKNAHLIHELGELLKFYTSIVPALKPNDENNDRLYLCDNGKRREIMNYATVKRYYFNQRRAVYMETEALSKIPNGPPILFPDQD